jgi:4-amino-4-deoxy-L-arabinose transferase-like glycosyltransferase
MSVLAHPDRAPSARVGSTVKHAPWLAAGALIGALVVPWLLSRGMFWDGVIYSTVARNMTLGLGDAWHPMVTGTFMRHFHEHPPLAFWLQAAFFEVLGDHFWVERAYSLVALAATLTIMVATWRWLLRDSPRAAGCGWLALVLWAPWGTWCFRHNMLENTMGVFTGLSVYASLRAIASARRWPAWATLAGVSLAAAVMTKGPPALFPTITPLLAWLTIARGERRRVVVVQSAIIGVLAVSLSALLMSEDARSYLGVYWHEQVVSSLLGERERVGSVFGRLNIVMRILRELRIPLAAAGGLLVAARVLEPSTPGAKFRAPMWFCLLTALSASLPIALSPKQGGHYSAPSWPYYSFAVALWCVGGALVLAPRAARLVSGRPRWWIAGTVACGMLPLLAAVVNYGQSLRDREVIDAAHQLASGVEPGSTLMPIERWNDLSTSDQLKLHVYLYRYHQVSLFLEEPRPAFDLEIHRLQRPADGLLLSSRRAATRDGLACQLLDTPSDPVAAAPKSAVRR